MKPTSYEIGSRHERRVKQLLEGWQVKYESKKKFKTALGTEIEVDFWLSPTETRPAIIIECKEFGVAAKSVADSRRRKVQEALWLLVQVRRHCPETSGSRIVIVTGKKQFLPEQVKLLKKELGSEFNIVSVDSNDELRRCVE